MILFGVFDLWIVFYTIIIVLLLIGIIVAIQLGRTNDTQFKVKEFNEIDLKTGDILGVSYSSLRGQLVRVFTTSVWTHIGLVVKYDDDDTYVVEMARYNDDEHGLIIKPFKDWLKWNQDNLMCLRRYRGKKKFPEKELKEFIEKHKDEYEEDMSVISWLKTCIRRRYHEQDKNYYYCSEFIIHAFQSIGIMKLSVMPSSFKPWHLIYGDIGTYSGYEYKKPVLLEF